MSAQPVFVIAGGGLAGAKTAEALRGQGFGGRVVLIGRDDLPPYERPPLSKEYLQGKAGRDMLFVHPREWYAGHDVDLLLDTTVAAIDRGSREVELTRGGRLRYDRLLLATGSSPRSLRLPGAGAGGIRSLRQVADSDWIRDSFASASRVLIIGAGWIGLEVAAAARLAGVPVTIVEREVLPLLPVLGSQAAGVFAGLHREHGVDLRLGAEVTEITAAGGKTTVPRVTGARLADGTRISADMLVTGVGAIPNTSLAEAAGLDVSNGVLTDASLRTCDPAIYAAGDVASAYHPLLHTHIRTGHQADALYQPETAAAAMLGRKAAYDRVPCFSTSQYGLFMDYAGYAPRGGYDKVIFRGDVSGREFIAFWMSRGRVVAGMNVNIPGVTGLIQALIRSRAVVAPARLSDPAIPLDEALTADQTRRLRAQGQGRPVHAG